MNPETEQTLATLEVILDKGLWFMPSYHGYGDFTPIPPEDYRTKSQI